MREDQTAELAEKLGKLRRNELLMTAEQKIQFRDELRAFKFKIKNLASEILHNFCLDGLFVLKTDEAGKDSVIRRTQMIISEEQRKGTFRTLGDILLKTGSPDAFLDAAIPLRYRIWYEAYAPYWLSRCQYSSDRQTYYNPIIEMWWNSEAGIWESGNGRSWRIAFPPTPELIQQRHREELAAYEVWEKSGRIQRSDSVHSSQPCHAGGEEAANV